MRCKSIRTVFRAALAAGLLATCQNAPLSASWTDLLRSSADTCYVHDLHWENFHSASNRIERFSKSIVKTDGETRLATDHETQACVVAAKLFEFNMQVDAVMASLQSRTHQLSEVGAKLFQGYCHSRLLLVSSIKSRSLTLVDWIKIPDSLPGTVVATEKGNDFECDWDCGYYRRDTNTTVSVPPPPRDLANIFVYTLVETNESYESYDSYDTIDTIDTIDSDSIDTIDSDSIGSEVLPSTLALSSENDSAPVDSGESHSEGSLDSPSETVALDSDTPLPIAHAWQVGVDPICTEVQMSNSSLYGSQSELSICCPVERTEEAIATHTSVIPPAIENRPPTLEAEFETLEAANDLKVYQYGGGYGLTGIETPCEPDLARTVPQANDQISEPTEHSFDGCDPWCDSLNWSPWSSRIGKRFAFGDNTPRMPMSGPAVAAYSKEDLEFASTFPNKLLDEFPSDARQFENAIESFQDETEANGPRFSPEDFLITSQHTTSGSIALPLMDSNRLAFDDALNIIAQPTAESNSRLPKIFASQIRTVGQFLVDFASQIENQVEQIELARRETNQR